MSCIYKLRLDAYGVQFRNRTFIHLKWRLYMLKFHPCIDSQDLAISNKQLLNVPRDKAAYLGRSAVEASTRGWYLNTSGVSVALSQQVTHACLAKLSIAPETELPYIGKLLHLETQVQVCNETTLNASNRLSQDGFRPLALNFANGVQVGGGFLNGALAQEEVLCRSSALHSTLVGDQMYEYHRKRQQPDSSDWAILSPDVPVFRTDDGTELDHPWNLSFLTSAAPYAPVIGQPESGDLLQKRIHRILEIASAYEYETIVLGAWGCGAFANDQIRTAIDFRNALDNEFEGHFLNIVFAITDWSPERRFLGSFRDVFSPEFMQEQG